MKIRKVLAVLCMVCLVAGLVSGCGGNGGDSAAPGGAGPAPGDSAGKTEPAFPTKNITIIVPWAVGGGGDLICRKAAEVMEKYVDVNVVVENDTGASGTIGMTDAYEADADGYTLVWAGGAAYAVTPQFIDVDYTFEDFFPIIGARVSQQDLISNPKASGIDSLEAIQTVGASRSIIVATAAPGNEGNILAQAILTKLGVDYEVVVYDGQAEMVNAIAGGQVDLALVASPTWWEFGEAGDIMGIATLGSTPVQNTPSGDLAPLTELGLDVTYDGYDFFACRSAVPEEIRQELVKIFNQVVADPDYTGYLEEQGFRLYTGDSNTLIQYTNDLGAAMEEYIPMAVK